MIFCEAMASYKINLRHLETAMSGSRVPFERLSLPIEEEENPSEPLFDCEQCNRTPEELNKLLRHVQQVAEKAGIGVERHDLPQDDEFLLWERYLDDLWCVLL